MRRALVSMVLLLLASPGALAAQELPVVKTSELPSVPVWGRQPAQAVGRASTLTIEVTPDLPSHYRPIGSPRLRALAAVVEGPDGPVVVVPELLVRDAKEIVALGERGEKTRLDLVRLDPSLGLAALALPATLTPGAAMPLGPSTLITRVDAVVLDGHGKPDLLPITLGDRGEGALQFYRGLSLAVPIGTPIIDQQGHLLALAALVRADDQTSWAIDAASIALFVKGGE